MAPPYRTTELAAKLWLAANIDRVRTNQRIKIRPLSEDAITDSYSRNKDPARPEAASAAQQQDGGFPAYKPLLRLGFAVRRIVTSAPACQCGRLGTRQKGCRQSFKCSNEF